MSGTPRYDFTSNRRTEDQAPDVPDAATARTRNHMRVVGSDAIVTCEAVVDWLATSGVENDSLSSIWIV